MNRDEIFSTVIGLIQQVAKEQSITIPKVEGHHRVVEDLGFASLDIATLASALEEKLKINPFQDDISLITEIHTVEDICNLYQKHLAK